jgi:predicted kinase
MSKPVLLCMYGLPRSGKTTLCQKLRKAKGVPVVNRDTIRLALHGHNYLGKAEPFVKAISNVMVEALFLYGYKLVVVDETCFSQAARDALKSDRWDTYFYEVPTSPDVCKERAIATDQAYLLPVIDEMWARREPLGTKDNAVNDLELFVKYYDSSAD